jgi:hypothetical protein
LSPRARAEWRAETQSLLARLDEAVGRDALALDEAEVRVRERALRHGAQRVAVRQHRHERGPLAEQTRSFGCAVEEPDEVVGRAPRERVDDGEDVARLVRIGGERAERAEGARNVERQGVRGAGHVGASRCLQCCK